MRGWIQTVLLLLVVLAIGACRSEKSTRRPAHLFPLPQLPAGMDREEKIDFMAAHYWDHFDFADTVALVEADSAEMLRHFSQFTALLTQPKTNRTPMDSLMRRASLSRTTLDYFASLAEHVLHDPNAPLRSSELYIPVLEAQLSAPYYDTYERIVPEHDLRMALQNRPGEVANDFSYCTRNGAIGSLHTLQGEHTLLFFSNPECAMCNMLKELLLHSPIVAEQIANGKLRVLLLYPDEELEAWRRQERTPAGWIDAYDPDCKIRREGLYDLRAIPSLYLLDGEKRVIVKDSTDPREIEQALL